MKKNDFVNVTESARYTGQDMSWTEEITGKTTYKKGHTFYHFSDTKLKSFVPKTTCFFSENKTIPGFCYTLTLNQDIA